jgi:hypothetical protein
MDIYSLTRKFWDFSFENTGLIKPNHIAIYFFAIEHCNRLGWKKQFGLPTTMVMEAVGIKSYNTYISHFNDLVKLNFFELIEKSKNQYSSNVIALSNFDKALDKALDKATIGHLTKQLQGTGQSKCTVDIPIYQYTNIPESESTHTHENKNNFDLIINLEKNFFFLEHVSSCSNIFKNVLVRQNWMEFHKQRLKLSDKFTLNQIIAEDFARKLKDFSKEKDELAIQILSDSMTRGKNDIYRPQEFFKKQSDKRNNGVSSGENFDQEIKMESIKFEDKSNQ